MNVSLFKRAIKAKKMTQEAFAEKVGISYPALKKYFRGDSSPSIEVFQKMCDTIGVDMEYAISSQPRFPYEFHLKHHDIYSLLVSLGYEVECNPNNEDEICIRTIDLEAYTNIEELSEKVRQYIQFEVYRLSKESC